MNTAPFRILVSLSLFLLPFLSLTLVSVPLSLLTWMRCDEPPFEFGCTLVMYPYFVGNLQKCDFAIESRLMFAPRSQSEPLVPSTSAQSTAATSAFEARQQTPTFASKTPD